MRKVFGIGETVLDIIFKDNQPVSSVPGGSTFNATISLGRCGAAVALLSEVGNDRVGRFVLDFMLENGVNTDFMQSSNTQKTPLSLAFLNEKNDAEYLFYHGEESCSEELRYPDIQADDIVLFGSYYAIDPKRRQQVAAFLSHAKSRGAIIYYDVNFRPAHASEKVKLAPNIIENLEFADIVRGSSEDVSILYGMRDADKVYRAEISFYTPNFIFTDSCNPVVLFGKGGFRGEFPTAKIDTVSTIGAGDNFNAGFIFGLLRESITREDLDRGLAPEQWQRIVATAQQFSADCCQSIFNYVSPDFGNKMKTSLGF